MFSTFFDWSFNFSQIYFQRRRHFRFQIKNFRRFDRFKRRILKNYFKISRREHVFLNRFLSFFILSFVSSNSFSRFTSKIWCTTTTTISWIETNSKRDWKWKLFETKQFRAWQRSQKQNQTNSFFKIETRDRVRCWRLIEFKRLWNLIMRYIKIWTITSIFCVKMNCFRFFFFYDFSFVSIYVFFDLIEIDYVYNDLDVFCKCHVIESRNWLCENCEIWWNVREIDCAKIAKFDEMFEKLIVRKLRNLMKCSMINSMNFVSCLKWIELYSTSNHRQICSSIWKWTRIQKNDFCFFWQTWNEILKLCKRCWKKNTFCIFFEMNLIRSSWTSYSNKQIKSKRTNSSMLLIMQNFRNQNFVRKQWSHHSFTNVANIYFERNVWTYNIFRFQIENVHISWTISRQIFHSSINLNEKSSK